MKQTSNHYEQLKGREYKNNINFTVNRKWKLAIHLIWVVCEIWTEENLIFINLFWKLCVKKLKLLRHFNYAWISVLNFEVKFPDWFKYLPSHLFISIIYSSKQWNTFVLCSFTIYSRHDSNKIHRKSQTSNWLPFFLTDIQSSSLNEICTWVYNIIPRRRGEKILPLLTLTFLRDGCVCVTLQKPVSLEIL